MTKVYLTSQAQKDLHKISSKDKVKILKKLKEPEENPYAGKKLSGKLKQFYSQRIWPYRAIYMIKNKEVWVVHLAHRQKVYK